MTLIEKVEKKYGSLKQEWVTEKGKVHEIRMIRELAVELKKVKGQLDRADAHADEQWRRHFRETDQLDATLKSYKQRTYNLLQEAETMRYRLDNLYENHINAMEEIILAHKEQEEARKAKITEQEERNE